MAKNTQEFHFLNYREFAPVTLTASLQTIDTGGGNDSVILSLCITNTSTTVDKTVTVADDAGNTIGVIFLPMKAGVDKTVPPIDPLNGTGNKIGKTILDQDGNYVYILPAGKKLQAKVDTVAVASIISGVTGDY